MCKVAGFNPVVAVVGSRHKMDYCKKLGADFVIDKSNSDLWAEVTVLLYIFLLCKRLIALFY